MKREGRVATSEGTWALALDTGSRRVYVGASLMAACSLAALAAEHRLTTLETVGLMCQLLLIGLAAYLVIRRREGLRSSLALCAGVAALIVLLCASHPMGHRPAGAPFWPVMSMALFTVFAVFTIRNTYAAIATSMFLVGCCAVALRLHGLAWPTAVLTVASPLCASVAVRVGLVHLGRGAAVSDLERRDRAEAKRREAEVEAQARQTRWVSRFVHDEVLHSLRAFALGPRIPAPEALALAGAALRHLDQTAHQQGDDASRLLSDALAGCAADCGVRVVATVDHIALPGPVVEAMSAATREALRNVRLHSGVHQAELTAHRRGSQVTVAIRDGGRGFDPAVARPGHCGLSDSLRGRMAEVGGEAIIESRPGQTTVQLRWRQPSPPRRPSAIRLGAFVSATRRATLLGAAPCVALNLVQAVIMQPHLQHPGPAVAGSVLVAVGFALAAPFVWRGRNVAVVAALLGVLAVGVAALATVSVTASTDDPMAYWLAGGVVPLVVVGAVLRPTRESAPFALAICAIPLLLLLGQGGGINRIIELSPAIFGPEYVLGAAYSLGWFVNRSVDRARADAERAEQGELRAYELRERERLLVERIANLRDDVAPFFGRIVAGEMALGSPTVVAEATRLEALVRDSINPAGGTDAPHLDAAVTQLRAAGAIVAVRTNGVPTAGVAQLTHRVLGCLHGVSAGSRLSVQLHADGGARVTLAAYNASVSSNWQAICPAAQIVTDGESYQTVLIPPGAVMSPTFGTRPRSTHTQSRHHDDAELLTAG